MYRKNPTGPVKSLDAKITPPSRTQMKESMEAMIHHFKLYTEGYNVPAGEAYGFVELQKESLVFIYTRMELISLIDIKAPDLLTYKGLILWHAAFNG